MNQYFERIDMFSKKQELPSRIRFMLRDVIDLRSNKWRPRPYQREDNVPQPLSRLREEAGFNSASAVVSTDKRGNTKNLMNIGDLSKLHGNNLSSLLLEDDGPSFTTTTDLHWGPNSFMPNETEFDIFSATTQVRKIETSQSTQSTNKSNSTYSTNITNTAPIKNSLPMKNNLTSQIAPHYMPLTSINNNISMAYTKVESHTDPYRTNKPSINNRPPFYKENVMGPQSNHDIGRQLDASNTFDRRSKMREPQLPNAQLKGVIGNSDDLRRREESVSLRNDIVSKEEVENQNYLGVRNGSDVRSPRFPPKDSMRYPMKGQSDEILMNSNNTHLDMNSRQSSSHDQPIEREQPSHHRNIRSNRSEFGPSDGFSGPRDRRFDRSNNRHEHQHRQPKFSGANYRLPGRENRHISGPQLREQFLSVRPDEQPESELNLNWRTKQIIPESLKQQSEDIEHNKDHLKTDHLVRINNSARIDVDRKPNVSYNQNKFELRRNDGPTDTDRFKRPQQAVNPLSHNGTYPQLTPRGLSEVHSVPPHHHQNRYEDRRHEPLIRASNGTSRPLDMDRSIKRHHENNNSNLDVLDFPTKQSQNPRHNIPQARVGHLDLDSADKRNRERFDKHRETTNAQTIENLRPIGRANRDDERNSQRTAFVQNQSSEFNHSPESNRYKDRRQDFNMANSKKDQPPASILINHSILSKPPTRMSETDFSLRPSHNLVGRIPSDNPMQSNIKPTNEKALIKANQEPQSITASRAIVDSNLAIVKQKSIEDPKEVVKICTTSNDNIKESTKDNNVNKFMTLIKTGFNRNPSDTSKLAIEVRDLKIPKNQHHECLLSVMKQSIIGTELEREKTSKLMVSLVPNIFESVSLLNAFKTIFEQLHALEAETPKVKTLVAEFLSRSVVDGLLSLEEVGSVLVGGKHHPLFLLLLQKLERSGGQAWLSEKFIASKINLLDMLPEVDRSKDRLASSLKDRCLGFLDPMLTIEPDLWAQMRDVDPSPAAIYRWVKDNVDQTIQCTPTFAHVFMICLLRYIYNQTTEKSKNTTQLDSDESNKSSPISSSSQIINEVEKELLFKYQQALQAIIKDKPMQLATLYALQGFYHGLDFPKGALLRWFHMLYDMSIVDDDVFFTWKEEINNEVPGKGQALFQVNTWLNWLAEAESEEEE